MKKLISLVAILVVALGASAQAGSPADLLQGRAVQDMQIMKQAGLKQRTITVGDSLSASGSKTVNGPTATARAAAKKAPSSAKSAGGDPKNVGDNMTLPDGTVMILCEDGRMHEEGEVLVDADGNRFEVKADGTIRFKSGPPASNPGNNTGTATAGTTTVVTGIDDKFRNLGDGRLVVSGDVRVVDAAGGATASNTSSQSSRRPASESFTEVDCETCPGRKQKMVWSHEVNDWVPYGTSTKTLKRNQALLDANGDVALLPRAVEEHRMDDNYGISTVGESEHMPDPRVVAADHSGDLLTSWQPGGGTVVPVSAGVVPSYTVIQRSGCVGCGGYYPVVTDGRPHGRGRPR